MRATWQTRANNIDKRDRSKLPTIGKMTVMDFKIRTCRKKMDFNFVALAITNFERWVYEHMDGCKKSYHFHKDCKYGQFHGIMGAGAV